MLQVTSLTSTNVPRLWIPIIIVTAALLRVAWAVSVPVVPASDSLAYDELARNLAFRGIYGWDSGELTAFWPPGTSFIYSLLFRWLGHAHAPIVTMNIALGVATLVLIIVLAKRWFNVSIALAAGSVYAFWPSQIQFTTILASDLIFNFLVLAALWCALEARIPSIWLRGLLTGILLAVAAYVRAQALLLPMVFALLYFWRHRASVASAIKFAAVALIAMGCCIAPWAARNSLIFGELVLISTNGGTVAWMGNNPATTGGYMALPQDVAELNEAQRDRVLGARATEYILDNPSAFAGRVVVKAIRTHERESSGVVWNEAGLQQILTPASIFGLKIASNVYWAVVLLLAFGGLALLAMSERWWALIHPAVLIWMYFTAVHAVTLFGDRYHFPSNPYIAMLSGLFIVHARLRWELRRSTNR